MQGTSAKAWLVLIGGPAIAPIELTDVPGGATLGRGEGVALPVPATADKVSRQHARFVFDARTHDDARPDAGGWRVADLGSRWGTSVNGVRLTAHREVPLHEGDLVRIEPWTFSFTTRGLPGRALKSEDDEQTMHTLVRSFGPTDALDAQPTRMGEDRLALLLESAAAIHAAETESALAEALLDAAARGTGLANASVLRPLDAAGHIQVIAARRTGDDAPAGFSRTLIDAASHGVVAELSGDSHFNAAMSILDMGVRSAICAPLMLGGAAAAYLYLDDRGARTRAAAPRHGAAQFALALSRMAGLALANLKRIEIEKRQATLELDLSAAAKAQKWILPKRVTQAGAFTCTGESRAGAYVGGDFFDVLPLAEHRFAVSLGDVSGHGVAASVLMTAAQGFLHAALRQSKTVADAVTDLNRFVFPRRPASSFLTLWVGVFNAAEKTLTYVNAGHGYAMLDSPDGPVMLDGGEDFPVGFVEDHVFGQVTVPLPDAGRATVVSDGVVEQFDRGTAGPRQQFGIDGVRFVLDTHPAGEAVAALFSGVIDHAGSDDLNDDATAVVITWG